MDHSASTANHIPFAALYADAAARTAATGFIRQSGGGEAPFDADDEGKMVFQLDNSSVWVLTDFTGPTWVQTSGVSASTTAIVIALGDETTAITTGTAKVTFRMPYGFTLAEVRGSLTDDSSSGTPTFDINASGATILSTKITIDVGELTSTTAAVPPVISDPNLADDEEITIDIDVAGTGAKGAKVYLIGVVT